MNSVKRPFASENLEKFDRVTPRESYFALRAPYLR